MNYKIILPIIIIAIVAIRITIDVVLAKKGKKKFEVMTMLFYGFFAAINTLILISNLN